MCYIISKRNMSTAILIYLYQRYGCSNKLAALFDHLLMNSFLIFSDMIRGTTMMVAWEWLITGTTNDQLLGKMILAASSDQYTDTSDRQRRNVITVIILLP